jgi:translocation and assembly module TamB
LLFDYQGRLVIKRFVSVAFKYLGITLAGILLLVIGLFLFIRSPWGQDIVVSKAVNYLSKKIETEIQLQKLFFTFKGDLHLEGLYIEDQKGDTLLYSGKLETGISLGSLLRDGSIEVSKVEWEGLNARVKRDSLEGRFNFDFIIDAFLSDTTEEDLSDPAKESETDSGSFPALKIGPVNLASFNLLYDDQVMGIRARADWELIHLNTNLLDLDKMNFDIQELGINNSNIDYFQYKPFPDAEEDNDPSDGPLPLLVLESLLITETNWKYHSIPDGIEAHIRWESFDLGLPEANLEDQKILLSHLNLDRSDIQLNLVSSNNEPKEPDADLKTPEFTLPDWKVDLGDIDLKDINLSYSLDGQQIQTGFFDPNAIGLEGFNFSAHAISLKDEDASFVLDHVSFKESSGFSLEELTTRFSLESRKLAFGDFKIQTKHTALAADLSLTFQDLNKLINSPEHSGLQLDVKNFQTDGTDALYFQPDIGRQAFFQEFQKKGLQLQGQVNGNLTELQIPNFTLNYGNQTELELLNVRLRDLLDQDNFWIEVPGLTFKSVSGDLTPFLEEIELNLPDELALDFNGKGSQEQMDAQFTLNTSDGILLSTVNFQDLDGYSLASELTLEGLDIGKILGIEGLYPISMTTSVTGKGTGLYDLEANLELAFQQFQFEAYDLSGFQLAASAKDTVGRVQASLEEEFLDFNLQASGSLDSLNPGLEFILDLRNAQLFDLGLTKQDISGHMQLLGKVEGSLDDLRAELVFDDAVFRFQRQSYPIGDFSIKSRLADFVTSLEIQSDFLMGDFYADGALDHLIAALDSYFKQYFPDQNLAAEEEVEVEESPSQTLKAHAHLKFHPTPFIDQLLVAGIDRMDTLTFDLSFDAAQYSLEGLLKLPMAQYGQAELDSFFVSIIGTAQELNFGLGFNAFNFDPIAMGETVISGNFLQDNLFIDFFSQDESGVLMDVKSQLNFLSDSILYQINPDGLIFNRKPWEVPMDNKMVFAPGNLSFEDFSFSRNGQSIQFSNQILAEDLDHVGIEMRSFELNTFFEFLNPEEPLLSGLANGELVVVQPFAALGLIADLRIEDVEVIDIPFGNLQLKASAETLERYDFQLALKEGYLDLDLQGKFIADSVSSVLDMQLDIHALQMDFLERLGQDVIRDTKGYISGNIALSGTVQEPEYSGSLYFNDASFIVTALNNRFLLEKESIKIDNTGAEFSKFTIKDDEAHAFMINGRVNTDGFTDLGFDLKLDTKDFIVLNSTRADNDLFFGKANVDLNMTIGGNLELPVIDTRLKVNRGTNISFIVPESQLDMIERTGVVLFVNHQDPYDLLYQRETDLTTVGIAGYDVKANLQVDAQTVFNLIVDERTGDNLRLQGEADLNMLMDPRGNISLSGRYEVKSGHYELNLFGLVNRRFELSEGSFVSWNGDPLDANLNLAAIYNVRTSAAELMQAQISGVDVETRGQFRQVLPFRVYLKVGGEIVQPEISFELDMPEQERGAFGGSVYSMLQQVNEKEDELTKQVFALLVLNQFFPMTGSDGASGGSVNLARSSVSQVLSSQMNALSERLFGETGFSLDLDLDSYTDFQSGDPQDRTQLSVAARQSLMDDRLILSVGGQVDVEGSASDVNQGDALFGDVSIEYLLDERGQWRAKAYRRNQFESIIDGQLIVTGISFIFNKEFNAFRELFLPMRKLEVVPLKEEEEEELVDEAAENND